MSIISEPFGLKKLVDDINHLYRWYIEIPEKDMPCDVIDILKEDGLRLIKERCSQILEFQE